MVGSPTITKAPHARLGLGTQRLRDSAAKPRTGCYHEMKVSSEVSLMAANTAGLSFMPFRTRHPRWRELQPLTGAPLRKGLHTVGLPNDVGENVSQPIKADHGLDPN